ncbi:hypothetical protein, partial [Microbacterium sp. AG1240]|uniref:hypothetical protein n=1 Tax=Microbacterium sp. AG1240 TaxID=2183992 RepID=UPI0015FF202F
MKITSTWKKMAAVAAVIALSSAGALLGTSAAQAAPADLSVTSPTSGQTVDSRTVTFTGKGTNGSRINVLDANGDRIPGTGSTTVVNGTWSTQGTYAADAPVAQTVYVNQLTGFSGDGEISVSFSLPAPKPVFSVTSPKSGETVDSRTITFTGTGENGSFVNVLDENGDRITGTGSAVVSNGVWSTTGTYPADAPVAQTITAFQTTGFSGNGEISVSFSLPAPKPVFSVTSPKSGETVDSRTITFTGTGENGSFVNVLDENGDRIPGTGSAVVSNGVWSTTGTYPADAPVAQTITAFQTTGFSGNGEISVSFSLPA